MDSFSTHRPFHPQAHARATGVAVVAGLHVLLVYALWSGLQHDFVQLIRTHTTMVVEVPQVEPPPPMPIVKEPVSRRAPADPPPVYTPQAEAPADTTPVQTIAATAELPSNPPTLSAPAIASDAPPAAPTDIRLACPHMVKPEMPRQAVQNGTSGVVRATAIIRNGMVREVVDLTGPRVFHAAVRAAMLQYRCDAMAGSISATQEFNFQLAD